MYEVGVNQEDDYVVKGFDLLEDVWAISVDKSRVPVFLTDSGRYNKLISFKEFKRLSDRIGYLTSNKSEIINIQKITGLDLFVSTHPLRSRVTVTGQAHLEGYPSNILPIFLSNSAMKVIGDRSLDELKNERLVADLIVSTLCMDDGKTTVKHINLSKDVYYVKNPNSRSYSHPALYLGPDKYVHQISTLDGYNQLLEEQGFVQVDPVNLVNVKKIDHLRLYRGEYRIYFDDSKKNFAIMSNNYYRLNSEKYSHLLRED